MAREQIQTQGLIEEQSDGSKRVAFMGGYAIMQNNEGFWLRSEINPKVYPDYQSRSFESQELAISFAFVISRAFGEATSEGWTRVDIGEIGRVRVRGGKRPRCVFYKKDKISGVLAKKAFAIARSKRKLLEGLDILLGEVDGN